MSVGLRQNAGARGETVEDVVGQSVTTRYRPQRWIKGDGVFLAVIDPFASKISFHTMSEDDMMVSKGEFNFGAEREFMIAALLCNEWFYGF